MVEEVLCRLAGSGWASEAGGDYLALVGQMTQWEAEWSTCQGHQDRRCEHSLAGWGWVRW